MGSTTALSNNKSHWYSFSEKGVYRFNIQYGMWDPVAPTVHRRIYHDPAFADPATNQLYVLNGCIGPDMRYGTLRYDTATSSSFNLTQNLQGLGTDSGITATWNSLKKTAFIFGGRGYLGDRGLRGLKVLYLYDPTSVGNITAASVTGDRPTGRYDHCMVEAYNGTKMILFGGYEGGSHLNDIYILDVESMKWTKGTPAGPTVARGGASCAVTNDLFVAWGGATKSSATQMLTTVIRNVTIIYNLKTNQWQDTYSPDPYVPPPPLSPAVTIPPNSGTKTGSGSDPTGTGAAVNSGATSGSNSSFGWIIGGAVGGGLAV
ncbi:Leucine-zipper-like transcriptional regulator 1, partial [Mortierella sp. AD032]